MWVCNSWLCWYIIKRKKDLEENWLVCKQRFQKLEWIAPLSLVIQFASLSLFLFYSRENAHLSIHLNFNGWFVFSPPVVADFFSLHVSSSWKFIGVENFLLNE